MNPLSAAKAYSQIAQLSGTGAGTAAKNLGSAAAIPGDANFSDMVHKVISDTSSQARETEALSSKYLNDEANLLDVVTSLNELDLQFQTIVSVRDRLVSAFNEVIRMPI